MKPALLLLAALAVQAGAQAQTTVTPTTTQPSGMQPALQVEQLAPQLVAFAGSDVNFSNLVNGLALGLPITLTTPIGPTETQVVTFTPGGTMSATQIAQTLETARQALIARGIATPTAQQLGIALTGGALPTALGATQITGLVPASTALGITTLTQAGRQTTVQSGQAAAGGTVLNRSDSPFPRGISDTPPTTVPGVSVPSAPPATLVGGPQTTTGTTTTTVTPGSAGTGATFNPPASLR